jgi:[acyl-carrier-protein] S-malonyltransferase
MFDLARADASTSEAINEWPVPALPDDDAALFENRLAQALIVAATLAMWRAISAFSPRPAMVAGYSVGELSAHAVAGTLTPAAALHVAGERARMMDACVQSGAAQAMLAVAALPRDVVAPSLARHGFYFAIENGSGNFIVGGLQADCAALTIELVAAGASVTPIDVHIASHTPLMAAAVPKFSALLERTPFAAPEWPVLAGISAQKTLTPEAARTALAHGIAEPVRWMDCMDTLVESGITVALELGPGATLARMLQARHPQIACRSVADFRSLQGIQSWLARQG